jgi:hypothetical protein
MKNQGEQNIKLSIKKFQISKIKNPNFILGGTAGDDPVPTLKTKPNK